MKVLITGATGLVGQPLLQVLIQKNHSVHYLTTRKGQTQALSGATGFYWNPEKEQIDEECFDGVDCVIHLAGASISQRWTKKNKANILDSRVKSTQLLFQTIKNLYEKTTIKHFISASAIGLYPSSDRRVYTEDYVGKPDSFLEKVCLAWEKEADALSALGLMVSKIRIGLVLTPKGGVLGPMKIPTSLGLGAAFGSGKQVQSWIHIDDLVQMFMTVMEKQWEGVYNGVSPNPVPQKVFAKSLAQVLRRPFFLPPVPAIFIRVIAGEMSVLVFNSQNVSAQKVMDKGFLFRYPNLKEAIKSLLN